MPSSCDRGGAPPARRRNRSDRRCGGGETPLIGLWFHPDGKEFGAQISTPGFVEADVAEIFGIGRSNVETFVQKPLRRIGVGVDDEGGAVNLARSRADDHVRPGSRFFWSLRRSQSGDQYEDRKKSV